MLWMLWVGCGGSSVVVNEIMASNTTILADDAGTYPDWIELYNKGNSDFPLDGYAIVDNRSAASAGLLDGLTVPANGYLIVFADDGAGDGHLGFKLNIEGDSVTLGTDNGDETVTGDETVVFGLQVTDTSYARTPNGGGEWVVTDAPTPGAANP